MTSRYVQTAAHSYVIAGLGGFWTAMWALADDGATIRSWWFLALAALIIPLGLLSGRLTVVVDDSAVTTAFGWGWPRRRIELAEIVGIEQVTASVWQGWGIRKVRNGWMFNVQGRDAVELTLASGRVFRIGTDQPAELRAAIERAQTA